ncbi:helix-turn-helix transcriptional regulator [Tamilnaduibacter salinus]|nr:helix-turn-helix transcriptional regulator [Tamilnaduibacter salinus]
MVFSFWGVAAFLTILLAQLDFSMQSYSYANSDVLKIFIYLGEYSVILHSFYVVLRNWESDLIEPSRKLRKTVFVSFAIGICIGAVGLNTGIMAEAYRPIVVIVGVLLVSKALYGFGHDELDHLVGQAAGSPIANKGPDEEDQSETESDSETKLLVSVMESEFYRELDATIGSLARRSGFPEYKVRRIISQDLGYRNFNSYLNRLRTKNAADRLIREPETPIKVIAYDVGYRSVTSFNRAFKEAYGVSPSTYRAVS